MIPIKLMPIDGDEALMLNLQMISTGDWMCSKSEEKMDLHCTITNNNENNINMNNNNDSFYGPFSKRAKKLNLGGW